MGASDALVARFVSEGAGASGQDAVDLITRATGAPGLYYFSELLDLPGVKQARRAPTRASRKQRPIPPPSPPTRDLIDPTAPAPPSPPLHAAARRHRARAAPPPPQMLRVGHAPGVPRGRAPPSADGRAAREAPNADGRTLAYADLAAALEISSVRALEDLLIDECVVTGLARGKLDQRAERFEVLGAAGRDVPPERFDALVDAVADWRENVAGALSGLDEKIAWARRDIEERERHKAAHAERVEAVKKTVKTDADRGGGGG
eukprot:22875-Pelagococcus_subviridis.AAC.1